jgi:predicted TIM-barrel fold metal-dependent hydrolase
MSKVIDLCMGLPMSEDALVNQIKYYFYDEGATTHLSYKYGFGLTHMKNIGYKVEQLDTMAKELSPKEFEDQVRARTKKIVQPLDAFIKEMDQLGVSWGVINTGGENLDKTAAIVAKYPKKLTGTALIDPEKGITRGVKELERGVKELGLTSLYISTFRFHLPCNDKKFYPFYAKAAELKIPVFIYTSLNLSRNMPMDIAHPRNVDEVARNFPELQVIAALAGWPWVPDMIGVARRNQNVSITTETWEPNKFTEPGSGWEMLMQFGNTLLQDRIAFATKWEAVGVSLKEFIKQMGNLPLKDTVKEKWLYSNAARIFNRP